MARAPIAPILLASALAAACAPRAPTERMRASQIERGVPAVDLAAIPVAVQSTDRPLHEGTGDVSFLALIAAGSAYDPIGREGAAWRVARALATGGEPGRWDVAVGREWASVVLTCAPERAAECAAVFGDALVAPAFAEPALAAARDQARAALEAPSADEVFTCALYEGHRYGHPPEGRLGVVDQLDAGALRAFHAAHYVRRAVHVAAAGPVPPEVRDALAERLLALPSALPRELPTYAPPRETAGLRLTVGEAGAVDASEAPLVRVGAAARIGAGHPDWPALWLGFAALRRELGLPVAFPSPVHAREYEDLVLEVPAERADAAAEAFAKWARDGVGEEALAATRAALGPPPSGPLQALALEAGVRPLSVDGPTAEAVTAAIHAHVDPERVAVVRVEAGLAAVFR